MIFFWIAMAFCLAVIGSVVLPAFGLWFGLMIPALFSSLLVYFGVSRRVLSIGILLAVLCESLLLLPAGLLSLSFAATFVLFRLIGRFVTIKTMEQVPWSIPVICGYTAMHVVMYTIFALVQTTIGWAVYGMPLAWRSLWMITDPGVTILGLVLSFLLFSSIFRRTNIVHQPV